MLTADLPFFALFMCQTAVGVPLCLRGKVRKRYSGRKKKTHSFYN